MKVIFLQDVKGKGQRHSPKSPYYLQIAQKAKQLNVASAYKIARLSHTLGTHDPLTSIPAVTSESKLIQHSQLVIHLCGFNCFWFVMCVERHFAVVQMEKKKSLVLRV